MRASNWEQGPGLSIVCGSTDPEDEGMIINKQTSSQVFVTVSFMQKNNQDKAGIFEETTAPSDGAYEALSWKQGSVQGAAVGYRSSAKEPQTDDKQQTIASHKFHTKVSLQGRCSVEL